MKNDSTFVGQFFCNSLRKKWHVCSCGSDSDTATAMNFISFLDRKDPAAAVYFHMETSPKYIFN